MASSLDDAVEPLVDQLRFAVATFFPAITVAGALIAFATNRGAARRTLFSNIISDADIQEELASDALNDAARGGPTVKYLASEATPLLSQPKIGPRHAQRSKKSLLFVAIGALELVGRIALLVRSRNLELPLVTSIYVWIYATLMPLFTRPARPPYSLFAIYLLAVFQALLDVYLYGAADTLTLVRVLYIGHLALCIVGLLLVLSMPLNPTLGEPNVAKEGPPPAMDDYATLGQWLTVSWLATVLRRAQTGSLEDSDIPAVAIDVRSRLLARNFGTLWKERSLLVRLLLANLGDLFINLSLISAGAVLQAIQPILLNRILASIEAPPEDGLLSTPHATGDYHLLALLWAPKDVYQRDVRSAYLFSALAFVAMILRPHIFVLRTQSMRRVIVRARAEAIGEIYTKAFKRIDTSGVVDPKAKVQDGKPDTRAADMGKLVSLVSVDVNKITTVASILETFAATPLTIVITAWFLYSLIGYSGFVGYIFFLASFPWSWSINKRMMDMQTAVMQKRDLRMRSVNELLQSIKFVKFSAWETRWIDRVLRFREEELSQLVKLRVLYALFGLTWHIVPIIISCVDLAWFTGFAGGQLTVAIAFPTIHALAVLTAELNEVPSLFGWYGSIVTAFRRIDEFLGEEEVPDSASSLKRGDEVSLQFDVRLGATGASFEWYSTSAKKGAPDAKPGGALATSAPWWKKSPISLFKKPATPQVDAASAEVVPQVSTFQLHDINVVFPRGQLSVVTGATGSGKSSLLSALLGEMRCLQGRVLLPRFPFHVDPATGHSENVSYCAQRPWLESKTVRENILFGSPFDNDHYNAVLDACALVQDFNQWDDGDETEIGDNGIVLSGGQKARVALARAVYARTQTVLLDDVLSAVDSHTAFTLIENCLRGHLMHGRTVVLVTHHVAAALPLASWVVKMEDGRIVAQGTVADLRASGELSGIVRAEAEEEQAQEEAVKEETVVLKDKKPDEPEKKAAKKLVEAETKAKGSVRLAVYMGYFKAASIPLVLVIFACMFLKDGSNLVQSFWMKIWSESYERPSDWRSTPFGFPSASANAMPYVWTYVALQLGSALLILAGIIPQIWSSLCASRSLFKNMLQSVVRSPTRYFDKTPAGRILNRFSKDVDSVDDGLQDILNFTASQFVAFIVAITTITISVPPFIFAVVFLVWLHLYFARGYMIASRDMVRLMATTRSPVITTFGEVLRGLTTLRAFGYEFRFRETMFKQLDKFHSAFYLNVVINSWLRYRFDVLGAFTFFFSAVLSLYFGLTPGLTAIVLTQAENIVRSIYFGLRFYIMTENSMNGVERIEEYIALPSEPPRHVPDIPAYWPPVDADIVYDNVVLRYAPDLEPVLRGVTFKINAGEKIGIVGRTGSGKSTLAMSLFRFVDPDAGRITLGGVDITHIGVEDLRARLTLIPQDAVLFSGTIRENLDPFNEYSDEQCLNALRMVHLPVDAASNAQLDDGAYAGDSEAARPAQTLVALDSQVSEAGANWSAGQRQLIALARAILRNTGITVLDESTASVDFNTDRKIQNAIRTQFKNSILLTIAHRLHTIIDYDRVLVLENGKVVEFDTPARLIAQEGGVFRGMCVKSGHFAELQAGANAAATVHA